MPADPGTYGPSWHAAQVDAPSRPPLSLELDVDVCVVGAGLAGLTVARELARRDWSVAVLEARRVGWAASGRSSGFVLPGFDADPFALLDRVGLDATRALWTLSETGADYVRQTARDFAMPGIGLQEGGWLQVSTVDDEDAVEARATFLRHELGAAVEAWPARRVRAVLRSPRNFSALHFPQAFAINPLAYALGLAAAAEAAGVRIYEETPALELDPAGVRKRIATPSARVRANHVVLAGHIGIGALMPLIGRTLMPMTGYTIVTAPLGEALREAIAFPGMVSGASFADRHYRVVGGDRLMWSGNCTMWPGDPKWRAETLRMAIGRIYPQLAKVEVEHAWSGTFGRTVHRMPQIGELSPGVWLLSGFGGHGLNTTAMGGEAVARAIMEGVGAWEQFRPFDLVWAGGKLGASVVQVNRWYTGMHEQLAAHMARRRDAKRPSQDPFPDPAASSAQPQPQADGDAQAAAAPARKRRKRRKRNGRKRSEEATPAADNAG